MLELALRNVGEFRFAPLGYWLLPQCEDSILLFCFLYGLLPKASNDKVTIMSVKLPDLFRCSTHTYTHHGLCFHGGEAGRQGCHGNACC